jgi:hypothetical protein
MKETPLLVSLRLHPSPQSTTIPYQMSCPPPPKPTASPANLQTPYSPSLNNLKQPTPHLPTELWTSVLSHLFYPDLWTSTRLVSKAFHTASNFLLRTHYITHKTNLIHGPAYLSFSHFSPCNTLAYYAPSTPPSADIEAWTRQLHDFLESHGLGVIKPLVFLHLADRGPANHSDFPFMDWLAGEEDVSRTGFEEEEGGCVGVRWIELCIRFLVYEKDVGMLRTNPMGRGEAWVREREQKQERVGGRRVAYTPQFDDDDNDLYV